jgi:4-amino-4-deoxy-L-arabinose transferase-like glycosyltransferase
MKANGRSLSPTTLVMLFALFQLVVLTAVPTIFSSSPPLDAVESWGWAPHWLLGTYKHPPMPAWLLQAAHSVLPGYIFVSYLLSQIAVALTYVAVFAVGREMTDERTAAAGALLSAGSLYFTFLTFEFNHNVLQMPFWALTILTFVRLRRQPAATVNWIILGLLVGCGMYVKYSVAVLAIVLALAGLFLPGIRRQLAGYRPWLAIAIALLIFLPHVVWLWQNDFQPFAYAASRAGGRTGRLQPLRSTLAQIGDHTPILLLLAGVGLAAIRRTLAQQATEPEALRLLRIVTFAPFVLVVVGATLSGTALRDMWGMPFFTTFGLWLVLEFKCAVDRPTLVRLLAGAVVLVTITAIAFVGEAIWSRQHKPGRSFWPMQELADKAGAIWQSETTTPLAIVGGNYWYGGLVSIGRPERPDVVADDELAHSPWVTPEDIAGKGMLYLTLAPNEPPASLCANHGPAHEIILSNAAIPPISAFVCRPTR